MSIKEDIILSNRQEWYHACLNADIPAINIDTCARLMAILLVHGGGNELFVYNKSFLIDVEYIQKRFKLEGAGTPPYEFVELLKKYNQELENYMKENKDCESEGAIFHDAKPQWAKDLIFYRYRIKL